MYKPTIGLEIHVELKTRTKMFCDSLNDPDEHHPNENVCPVCLGHPGTLPVINKQAVEYVIRMGLALGGKIASRTKFDRKNYFYPDLPKNYQISQYDKPLVSGGSLNCVRITRVHLEEDAGRLLHGANGGSQAKSGTGRLATSDKPSASFVDFNRAGVPLMELVTEPDIKSADEAVVFAKELQLLARYLGISDADMEKGQMRIEANVSISDSDQLGTKVEVKNINSFKAVHGAIEYEIKRQEEVLSAQGAAPAGGQGSATGGEKGEKVRQETRGWDDVKCVTVSQRSKEEAHDYRYFAEPDLPPFETGVFELQKMKDELPELPAAKRVRFASEYGLSEKQAEILINESALAKFFEESASELKTFQPSTFNYQLLFNYLTSDILGQLNKNGIPFLELRIKPHGVAHVVSLVGQNKITSRQTKDILEIMIDTGEDPESIIQKNNMGLVADESTLMTIVEKIIAENPAATTDYKKGKGNALQFLIGKSMSLLKGAADPSMLRRLFEEKLR